MEIETLHPQFQLNGNRYSVNALKELAYSMIKEGEAFEEHIGAFILEWLSTSPTLIVNTSGSTGTPKPIVIKKEHMVNSALATGSFFGLTSGSTALHCLPTDFIAGKMMLVRAMVLGLRLTCIAPTAFPLEGTDDCFDFAAMVPLQLRNSIGNIDGIRSLIVGGAPFSEDLKKSVAQKSTCIFETYGMTETVTHVAVKQINHLKEESGYREHLFQAVPNVKFSVDNRGCLQIDAPKVSDTLVVTNDIVDLISATAFKWLGRFDNVINSGGVKLMPEQIEGQLSKLISQRFFVAGIPDERLGQKLVLLIEGNVGMDELKERIASQTELSKYQIPKNIFLVPEFVETQNGKIHRNKTVSLILE